MNSQFVGWLSLLLTAHAWADFVLQTDEEARDKQNPKVLFKHGLTHCLLTWLLLGNLTLWPVAAVLAIAHLGIDLVKACQKDADTCTAFTLDQLTHLLTLVAASVWLSHTQTTAWWLPYRESVIPLVLCSTGALITVWAGSFFVAKFVNPYLDELSQHQQEATYQPPARGLEGAGATIGKLERALVFLLVLVGQPGGIAFLVAAKSIFRFGELKETANRMESEYILIGTLASFLFAILCSYATHSLLKAV